MAQLFAPPFTTVLDANGNPVAGAKLYFYATGTTTPQTVYTTSALNVAHSSPVVADSAGRVPAIYLDATIAYRCKVLDGSSVLIRDIDPLTQNDSNSSFFAPAGTGAVTRTVQDKLRDTVSARDFGAVGDGVTDDTAAIQACIDANKGKSVVLPAGYTFLCAGVLLNGSTYDGTTIINEGIFKLKPASGASNFQSSLWMGIALQSTTGCRIINRGVMDGNRANQDASEHRHLIVIAGAQDFVIDPGIMREVRGDCIFIAQSNILASSTNPKNGVVGYMLAYNSADDGRNAVSLLAGQNITFAGGVSYQIGGIINSVRMPGGFDIEPDYSYQSVSGIRSGPWTITTLGATGMAVLGVAITNDATRDWNVQDVYIQDFSVTQTGSTAQIGGPIFRRCANVQASGSLIRTSGSQPGIIIDYADICDFDLYAKNCSNCLTVGELDFVNKSRVNIIAENHSGAGLLVVGADSTTFTGVIKNAVGGSAYSVQVSAGARGTVTQAGVTYSVDCPYDANNSFAFQTGAGVTFTDCAVANCAFAGYADYSVMFGLTSFIPTRNILGRNFATAQPSTGYWRAGDWIEDTAPAIAAGKVRLGWRRLVSGNAHVTGTDWTPIYGTTS